MTLSILLSVLEHFLAVVGDIEVKCWANDGQTVEKDVEVRLVQREDGSRYIQIED